MIKTVFCLLRLLPAEMGLPPVRGTFDKPNRDCDVELLLTLLARKLKLSFEVT